MRPVDRSIPVDDDEPLALAVKSISPHFKASSCRLSGSKSRITLKKLVSLKVKGTDSTKARTTLPQLAPIISLPARQSKINVEKTHASSLLNYSTTFGAFAKVKPLATLIARLPESQVVKISSKTSLSNSIDGITENMPETLNLGPRVTSLCQPGSEVDGKVKPITNTSTALTFESGIKGPIKIFQTNCMIRSNNQVQSPVSSYNKNSVIDQAEEEQSFRHVVHRRMQAECPDQTKRKNLLNIKDWNCLEVSSANQSHKQNSPPEGYTHFAAKGDSSRESPNMLMSPKSRKEKANLNKSGHLLDLVDPNDGFDLDILSIAELQANSSNSQKMEGEEKQKKMTKIFNFDHCTVNKGKRLVRKSVDCGKVQSSILKSQELESPDLNRSIDHDHRTFQRFVSGKTAGCQKRITSKPLPVNFDKIRLISRELQANKLQERVSKTIIKPSFQLMEDL